MSEIIHCELFPPSETMDGCSEKKARTDWSTATNLLTSLGPDRDQLAEGAVVAA